MQRKKDNYHGSFKIIFILIIGTIVLGVFISFNEIDYGHAIRFQRILTCNDGFDNDADSFTDLDDSGCENKNDDSELSLFQCDDGIDNDKDIKVDYPDDYDCDAPNDNLEGMADYCDDSDNGINIGIKGYVKGVAKNIDYSWDDYCKNEKTLIEATCINNKHEDILVNCDLEGYRLCDNGKCLN